MTLTVTRKHFQIVAALVVATAFGVLLLVNQQWPALAQQGDADKPVAKLPEPPVADVKPEPKNKPAPEPATRQQEPSSSLSGTDAGEPVFDAIPGAVSISMLPAPELVVVPADPNKARAEQVEWRYIPTFRLVEVKYDSERKLLTCRIDPCLSEQTKARVFDELRKQTGAPAQTAFRLNPVRIQSLVVELRLPKQQKVILFEEKSGHDITSTSFTITPFEVEDTGLDKLLSSNLRDLTLSVRTTHPYAAITRHTAHGELSMTATREAFEKVLPKGMKLEDLEKHPLIVDRDSALHLRQLLREEFRVKYEGDPAKLAPLLPALEKVLARITVSDVPLHQVTGEMIDQAVMWDSKTGKLDVSPGERSVLKKSWEEMTEKRTALKHAWDTLREEAKKSGDAEAWHNTLSEKSKLDARLKVGIGIFGGSASMNLEKEFAKSDEGSKQASREAFEKMRNAGEMSQETLDKSSIKGQGEDFARSAAGKILNLQRVTNLNAASFRSALVEVVERMSKGMLERVTLLPLVPSDTQQADALREIELMKKDVAALRADLKQRDIDELGTMKPLFSDSDRLPKGWVFADGKTVWPSADWVPFKLRGKAIPDMREHLVGGAKNDDEIGRVFSGGKLTVAGANVDGKSFKTAPNQGVQSSHGGYLLYPHGGKDTIERIGGMPELWGVASQKPGQTVGWTTIKSDDLKAAPGDAAIQGQQVIPNQTLVLNSASSNPRHVMCFWIVRVSID